MIDRLANLDAVCTASASRTEGGWRALELRAWDGIDARLLPDRGFDCSGAWYLVGLLSRGPTSAEIVGPPLSTA